MNSNLLEKTIANMEAGGRRSIENILPQWLLDCEYWECRKCVRMMKKKLADREALVLVSGDE